LCALAQILNIQRVPDHAFELSRNLQVESVDFLSADVPNKQRSLPRGKPCPRDTKTRDKQPQTSETGYPVQFRIADSYAEICRVVGQYILHEAIHATTGVGDGAILTNSVFLQNGLTNDAFVASGRTNTGEITDWLERDCKPAGK